MYSLTLVPGSPKSGCFGRFSRRRFLYTKIIVTRRRVSLAVLSYIGSGLSERRLFRTVLATTSLMRYINVTRRRVSLAVFIYISPCLSERRLLRTVLATTFLTIHINVTRRRVSLAVLFSIGSGLSKYRLGRTILETDISYSSRQRNPEARESCSIHIY